MREMSEYEIRDHVRDMESFLRNKRAIQYPSVRVTIRGDSAQLHYSGANENDDPIGGTVYGEDAEDAIGKAWAKIRAIKHGRELLQEMVGKALSDAAALADKQGNEIIAAELREEIRRLSENILTDQRGDT